MGRAPKLDPVAIRESMLRQFDAYDREPFRVLLTRIIGTEPSNASLRKFANKFPDRWASTVATLARLAGYTDRTESLNVSILMNVSALSDAEIFSQLEALNHQLLLIAPDADDQHTDEVAIASSPASAPKESK